MTTPIQYSGPAISSEVPWEIRIHLQAFYQKLANHTQGISLLAAKVTGSTTTNTTVQENITTGGGSTPGSVSGIPVNNQSGVTSYSTTSFDNGGLLVLADASPVAVTLVPSVTPYGLFVANQGTGTVTLTPSSGTINGSSTFSVTSNQLTIVAFDGTNWWASTQSIVPLTFAAVAHEWLNSYNAATGLWTAAQPSFTDISGVAAVTQGGTGTATLTPASGTISYAGNPGASSMAILANYCAMVAYDGTNWWAWTEPIVPVTFGAVAHEWLTGYNAATGAFTAAQPAFSDISGQITSGQLPSSGLSVTITTAKLTTGGANGSQTFTNGQLTAQVQAT